MKKHLIAAAVAAVVAVPAAAQVTVSGVLDAAAHSAGKSTIAAQLGGATVTEKTSGSNFLGEAAPAAIAAGDGWSTSQVVFTATEDLGGGLRATAVFSSRLSQNGTVGMAPNALGNRDRYVELSGGFGAVRVGRFAGTIDGHNGFSGAGTTGTPGALNTFSTGGAGSGATASRFFGGATGLVGADGGSFERNNNLVQYSSPVINGITLSAGFTDDSRDISNLLGQASAKMQYAGLQYSAGPLALSAQSGQRKVSVEGAAAVNETSNKADFDWIGARYDFGMVVLNGSFATRKGSATDANGITANSTDARLSALGVAIPVGAITLRASMYTGKDNRGAAATDNTDLAGNQFSATYNLSKRTLIYAATGKNEVKQTSGATSTAAGSVVEGTNIGISHSF